MDELYKITFDMNAIGGDNISSAGDEVASMSEMMVAGRGTDLSMAGSAASIGAAGAAGKRLGMANNKISELSGINNQMRRSIAEMSQQAITAKFTAATLNTKLVDTAAISRTSIMTLETRIHILESDLMRSNMLNTKLSSEIAAFARNPRGFGRAMQQQGIRYEHEQNMQAMKYQMDPRLVQQNVIATSPVREVSITIPRYKQHVGR